MGSIKSSENNISGRQLHTHTKWLWIAVLCAMSLGSSSAWAVRGRPHLDTTLGYNVLLSDNDTLLRGVSLSWDGGDPYNYVDHPKVMPTQAQLDALATDYGLNTVHLYLEGDSTDNTNSVGYNAPDCDILVQRCADANLYLIITIGCNGENGYFKEGQQIDMVWSQAFWNFYGPRYKDETHVIYEAHNEPAGWTPNQWAPSDWENQITFYNTIRAVAPDTFILLGSFMGFAGDITWGENHLRTNGVSWSNAGFAYHGYESLEGIEANIERMKASTLYPALLCTEFGKDETINSNYNSMCESHYNGWMQFQWLGANDADLLDFKSKIESAGTIWRPDNTSCNWPSKGTLNIPTGTIGLFDRGQDMFVTSTSANSDNLRAEAATYTASADDAFIIDDLGAGLVALKRASDNEYVRTTSETDSLTASQASVGINEMFEFLRLDNDDIALRAYGGGGHLVKSSIAGTTLVPDGDSGSSLDTKYVILTAPGGKPAPILSPYHGTPSVIPGSIEAEDFDLGGAGLAYSDTDSGNGPGHYRPEEDVDIETYASGKYNIGYIAAGEWLVYTVDVEKTADYILDVSVAGAWSGKTFHVEYDGVNKTGSLTVPHVENQWYIWKTISVTVTLDAGIQIMKFVAETGQHNLDKFTLTRIGGDCDIDGDDKVDIVDFAIFGQNWQDTSCGTCGDADFTDDSNVNINDLYLLAENWLNDYSLMGHWALDGDATDSSYYVGDGTVYGTPAWDATEHIGGSMVFDGINDYIEIQDYTGVSGSHSRTIAAWINADPEAAGVIVNWGSLVDGGKWRFLLLNGALRVSVQGSGKTGTTDLRGAGWHHIAAVFENDGTPDVNDIKFYIDGAEDAAEVATPMTINTTSNQNVSMGAALNGATPSQYFKGQIDDVRIYNRALDVTEIQTLLDMGP